jgi:hypothetical protein
MLSEARVEMGLSESQREQRFVALRAGLALGALPSIDGELALNSLDFDGAAPSSVAAAGPGTSTMQWLWGVNPLKLLGAGLALGGTLGFLVGHTSAPTSASDSGRTVIQSSIPAEVQEDSALIKADDRPGTPLSEIPLDEEPAHAPTDAHNKAHKSAASSTPLPEKAAEPSFHEELSFLRRAQAALRSGQPALALGLMQSLDEMQKGGALGLERRVTKTLALCALDRSAEAKAMAAPVFQSQPDSVYARRLSESCAGSPDAPKISEKK